MKKNSKIKVFILIIISVVFLTGCGWNDVRTAVGDEKINQGTSCIYNYTSEKYNGIEKITFSIDSTGLYISFNDLNKSFITGPNEKNFISKFNFNNKIYILNESFGDSYFSQYKKKNNCPSTIYIDGKDNTFKMSSKHSANDPIKDYAYTTGPTNVGGTKCFNSKATVCDNNCTNKDSLLGNVCFEWGYENNNEKYFWISEDNYFSSKYAMEQIVTGSYQAITDNGMVYYEIQKGSINDIWLGNNQVASKDKIDFSREPNTELTQIYIYSTDNPVHSGTKSDGDKTTVDGEKIGGGRGTSTIEYNVNLNYNNFCGNEGVSEAIRIVGSIIFLVKIVVPLIIIVLGIVDFVKAITSDDEKAVSKAAQSLIRRIISGIVIYFIPTIIWGILNVVDITDGMHDLDNSEFGACTKCVLKRECE